MTLRYSVFYINIFVYHAVFHDGIIRILVEKVEEVELCVIILWCHFLLRYFLKLLQHLPTDICSTYRACFLVASRRWNILYSWRHYIFSQNAWFQCETPKFWNSRDFSCIRYGRKLMPLHNDVQLCSNYVIILRFYVSSEASFRNSAAFIYIKHLPAI